MERQEIFQTFENIIKSPQDERTFKGFQLNNGMKVLLVSDPQTEKSAASMDVHIGHMSDPIELPGLAHFCEHMLFLGTEKYPDENDYGRYISQHGGSSNAYTALDHTNFHFDVSSGHLEEALERFSQFFLCPLFTESASDREVRAVNSEHEKNLSSDFWRLIQLEKSLCDPNHDYSKFGNGNLKTLDEIPKANNISVRDELIKFHDKWYSSNIMTLAVLGSDSIDKLEAMVVENFKDVQNKNVMIPQWIEHPFVEEDSPMRVYVVPVKDIRNLTVTFPIPDLLPYYRTCPAKYVAQLMGHEGRGSLLSELKARGWVNSLGVGEKSGAKGFSFFCINVDLTETGIDNTDEIIGLMFQYLAMLKRVGPQEWIFNECRDINNMLFLFKDKERPISFVTNASGHMHDYPMDFVMFGPYVVEEWKPELITDVMEMLKPEHARIFIVSKSYDEIADETEKWYGTKYFSEKIEQSLIDLWSSENPCPQNSFAMPCPNDFIPTDFELAERDPHDTEFPTIIKQTPLLRLWFKQDNEFLLPKANLFFEFKTPIVYSDPTSVNLTSLFLILLKDELNEYVYAALLAGMGYGVYNTKHGIILSVRGYSQKQHLLLRKVVSKLFEFDIDPERFEILKEEYIRSLKNFQMDQPHQHSIYNNNVILSAKDWHKEDLLEVEDDITVEALRDYIPRILKRTFVEILMHGNLSKNQALSLTSIVEEYLTKFNCNPLSSTQLMKMRDREAIIEPDSHFVYETTNEYHKSSSIEAYYQTGPQNTRDNVILELISQLIHEPCFNILRTKEQLGYLVHSGLRRSCGIQGLRIIIRSDRHPVFLDSRIETFLESMYNFISEMNDEEFERNKSALKNKRLEKPKQLSSLAARFWQEILCNQLNFNRHKVETDELENITKKDVLIFFDTFLAPRSSQRKKLACHVISKAEEGAGLKEIVDMTVPFDDVERTVEHLKPCQVIDDKIAFKAGVALYPQARPYVDYNFFIRK